MYTYDIIYIYNVHNISNTHICGVKKIYHESKGGLTFKSQCRSLHSHNNGENHFYDEKTNS